MKQKELLLGLVIIFLFGGAWIFFHKDISQPEKELKIVSTNKTVDIKTSITKKEAEATVAKVEYKKTPIKHESMFYKKKKNLEASIRGAMEFEKQIKADPETGKVDPKLVAEAYRQTNLLKANNSKRGGDSLFWKSKGPDNIGGRTRAIVVDNQNNKILYAGAVSGGFWKSENGGVTWKRKFYKAEYGGLSVVCITQAKNGDLYFGTGENKFTSSGSNNDNTGATGNGVYKSTDRGETWTHLTATKSSSEGISCVQKWDNVSDIVADPTNENRIFAATGKGLSISTDGGATWNDITNGLSKNVSYIDLEISPDGKTIFAVSFSTSSSLYRSTDGGNSFSKVDFGVTSTLRRIDVAIAPSNPNYVYITPINVSSFTAGIFQSNANGADGSWTEILPPESSIDPFRSGNHGQGWYDNVIAVDPNDHERIFVGGISFWMWEKGQWSTAASSTKWSDKKETVLNQFYVHPDIHTVVFDKKSNPQKMYLGTDAGIFLSESYRNKYITYKEINQNYVTTQFYGLAASKNGDILGGTQDNGTIRIDYGGLTGSSGRRVLGGDGFQSEISNIDPNIYFMESQYARLIRSNQRADLESTSSFYGIKKDAKGKPILASGKVQPSFLSSKMGDETYFAFNTPFRLWEDTVQTLIDVIDSITFDTLTKVIIDTTFKTINIPADTTFDGGHVLNLPDTFKVYQDSILINRYPNTDTLIALKDTLILPTNFYVKNGTNYLADTIVWFDSFMVEKDSVTIFDPPNPDIKKLLKDTIANLPPIYYFIQKIRPAYDSIAILKIDTNIVTKILADTHSHKVDTLLHKSLLYIASHKGIWVTAQAVDFKNTIPDWFQVNTKNISPLAMASSKDGDVLFYSSGRSLYRISGLQSTIFDYPFVNNTKTELIHSSSKIITDIAIDHNNPERIIITLGNYTMSKNHIYECKNALAPSPSFSPISADMPNMPVYSAIIPAHDSKQLIVGTELGVFHTKKVDGTSTKWTEQNNGDMERVAVYKIRQVTAPWTNGKPAIFIATHGRGFFMSTDFAPNFGLEEDEKNIKDSRKGLVKLYPNPANDNINVEFELKSGSDVNVLIFDMQGKSVLSKTYKNLQEGYNNIKLDIHNYNKGTYFVRVVGERINETNKFMIVK